MLEVKLFVIIKSKGVKKLFLSTMGEWIEITHYGGKTGVHYFTKKSIAYEIMDSLSVKETSMKIEEVNLMVD